ncbi:hypothetical protein B9H02_08905 [Prosthecochloris sp. HL-130-GSB]|nr:hypothetical protein B9H02_08905 [Prosthecochloris sp. HL-130-GSB]
MFATVDGDKTTYGHASDAVVVQSIGGGGGNGGMTITGSVSGAMQGSGSLGVGLGGFGGGGGKAGNVSATVTGDHATYGDHSTAVFVQSLGGGGGNGGINVTGAISGAKTGSGALSVGLGGFGSAGEMQEISLQRLQETTRPLEPVPAQCLCSRSVVVAVTAVSTCPVRSQEQKKEAEHSAWALAASAATEAMEAVSRHT